MAFLLCKCPPDVAHHACELFERLCRVEIARAALGGDARALADLIASAPSFVDACASLACKMAGIKPSSPLDCTKEKQVFASLGCRVGAHTPADRIRSEIASSSSSGSDQTLSAVCEALLDLVHLKHLHIGGEKYVAPVIVATARRILGVSEAERRRPSHRIASKVDRIMRSIASSSSEKRIIGQTKSCISKTYIKKDT